MALELIAALVAAAVLGLLAWAFRRWVPSSPNWLIPVAAGAGLIGFTIWSEHNRFARVSAELPPELEIVAVEDEAMPLRPWTYLKPIKMRFAALDHRKTLTHPQKEGLRLVTVYSFARWKPVTEGLMAIDCPGGRHVMVVEGVKIEEDGSLTGAEWETAPKQAKLQEAACREG